MKTARIVICAILVVMFLSFQAQDVKAYSFDYNINNGTDSYDPTDLSDFLTHNGASFSTYSDGFSGTYYATFIGYRAMNKNKFTAINNDPLASFFITDHDPASSSHSPAGAIMKIDGATAYFDDTTDGPTGITLNSAQYLMKFKLNQNWTYTGKSGITLNFFKGDIIVGFGDAAGDYDYLDLVVGLSDTNRQVPIPAAIWLLGSGLLGLIGVRRRKKL